MYWAIVVKWRHLTSSFSRIDFCTVRILWPISWNYYGRKAFTVAKNEFNTLISNAIPKEVHMYSSLITGVNLKKWSFANDFITFYLVLNDVICITNWLSNDKFRHLHNPSETVVEIWSTLNETTKLVTCSTDKNVESLLSIMK